MSRQTPSSKAFSLYFRNDLEGKTLMDDFTLSAFGPEIIQQMLEVMVPGWLLQPPFVSYKWNKWKWLYYDWMKFIEQFSLDARLQWDRGDHFILPSFPSSKTEPIMSMSTSSTERYHFTSLFFTFLIYRTYLSNPCRWRPETTFILEMYRFKHIQKNASKIEFIKKTCEYIRRLECSCEFIDQYAYILDLLDSILTVGIPPLQKMGLPTLPPVSSPSLCNLNITVSKMEEEQIQPVHLLPLSTVDAVVPFSDLSHGHHPQSTTTILSSINLDPVH